MFQVFVFIRCGANVFYPDKATEICLFTFSVALLSLSHSGLPFWENGR